MYWFLPSCVSHTHTLTTTKLNETAKTVQKQWSAVNQLVYTIHPERHASDKCIYILHSTMAKYIAHIQSQSNVAAAEQRKHVRKGEGEKNSTARRLNEEREKRMKSGWELNYRKTSTYRRQFCNRILTSNKHLIKLNRPLEHKHTHAHAHTFELYTHTEPFFLSIQSLR